MKNIFSDKNIKKFIFNDLLDKLKDLNSEGNTLEIGSYYGVFSNIAKKYF